MVETNKKTNQAFRIDKVKKQMLEQSKEPAKLNFFHVLYAPLTVAFIVVVYLLTTDMSDWVFNLGQYNSLILEYLPHAQTWVNSSGKYREKMILIYLIYLVFMVYMVLSNSFYCMKYWKVIMVYGEHSRKKIPSFIRLIFLILGGFAFMLLGGYCVTALYLGGSDVFLTNEQLDALDSKSRFSFYAIWNSRSSFVKVVLVSMAGWMFLMMGVGTVTHNFIKIYRKLREKIVNFKL